MRRIPRPSSILHRATRLRQRSKLIIIFCGLIVILAAGYVWWYIPHRPSALAGAAALKSLQQQGMTFSLSTTDASALVLTGKIDKRGNSDVEFTKSGQRFELVSLGDESFLKSADGQWFSVPSQTASGILPIASPVVQSSALQVTNRQKLQKMYRKHPFIVVDGVFKDEKIVNQDCLHYRVVISKSHLRDFLTAVQHDMPEVKLQTSQIDTTIDASFVGKPLGVWIGKKDGLVHQLSFVNGSIDTKLTVMTYGQTADIAKPQNAKALMTSLQR
jgi:hypothetical protein